MMAAETPCLLGRSNCHRRIQWKSFKPECALPSCRPKPTGRGRIGPSFFVIRRPRSGLLRYVWLQQNEPKIAAAWPHGVVCLGSLSCSLEHLMWLQSGASASHEPRDAIAARLRLSGEPVQQTKQLFEALRMCIEDCRVGSALGRPSPGRSPWGRRTSLYETRV